jgi:hypothetical protein
MHGPYRVQRHGRYGGVCLLPASVGAKWLRELVEPYAELEFLPGKLRFNDGNPAPFWWALATYRGKTLSA